MNGTRRGGILFRSAYRLPEPFRLPETGWYITIHSRAREINTYKTLILKNKHPILTYGIDRPVFDNQQRLI
jgi:hypothetical protein